MEIVYYPHPVLLQKAVPVQWSASGLQDLVEGMREAMDLARGVGLAAPQVGVGLRLFLACEDGAAEEALVCVNPRIETFGPTAVFEEGCLSLPGINRDVRRPTGVRMTAYDLTGKEFRIEAEGLLARILQHEHDHLNGILFFERMSEADRLGVKDDLKAFEDQYRGPAGV